MPAGCCPGHDEGVPELEAKTLNVQGMPGKWLEPNRDYLICFKFPKTQTG